MPRRWTVQRLSSDGFAHAMRPNPNGARRMPGARAEEGKRYSAGWSELSHSKHQWDGSERPRSRAKGAYCERGAGRSCNGGATPPPTGNWMYGAMTNGIAELGVNSVGVAIGCASTIGCRESGAVCSMVPL